MTEQLPITIQSNDLLKRFFTGINSIINKLEAQFNFQTLAADWYGDEGNILSIKLLLLTLDDFSFEKEQLDNIEITHFADDVFSTHNKAHNQIDCFIAITVSELDLLTKNQKLLPGYLQTKVRKVLNLIADTQNLSTI